MSVAFASRNPTAAEVERLRLVLSTFRDGSGMLAAGDETFPGWRDFERAIAVVLGGKAPETKGVFDVVIPATQATHVDYGLSVKSKAFTAKGGLTNLAKEGRVHMELSNSPAKFLVALGKIGFKEANFSAKKNAQEAGDTVLRTVSEWHEEAVKLHQVAHERVLDLKSSRYLMLSYCLPKKSGERHEYQWHTFSLGFPKGITWKYSSNRCLRGFDPAHPREPLFDFYLLSGGQLKYYPRASTALYSSPIFQLAEPRKMAATQRAARMYPRAWLAAGGTAELSREQIELELDSMAHIASDPKVKLVLEHSLAKIRTLAP